MYFRVRSTYRFCLYVRFSYFILELFQQSGIFLYYFSCYHFITILTRVLQSIYDLNPLLYALNIMLIGTIRYEIYGHKGYFPSMCQWRRDKQSDKVQI